MNQSFWGGPVAASGHQGPSFGPFGHPGFQVVFVSPNAWREPIIINISKKKKGRSKHGHVLNKTDSISRCPELKYSLTGHEEEERKEEKRERYRYIEKAKNLS